MLRVCFELIEIALLPRTAKVKHDGGSGCIRVIRFVDPDSQNPLFRLFVDQLFQLCLVWLACSSLLSEREVIREQEKPSQDDLQWLSLQSLRFRSFARSHLPSLSRSGLKRSPDVLLSTFRMRYRAVPPD